MARTSSKTVKTIPTSETGSRTTCLNGKYLITNNPLKEQSNSTTKTTKAIGVL